MKKILSLALAMLMAFALTVPALADEDASTPTAPTTGSVTISNATEGQEYAGYKLFDVTYSTNADNTKNMSYTITEDSQFYAYVAGTNELTYLPKANTVEGAQASEQESPFALVKNLNGTYNVSVKTGVSDSTVVEWLQNLIDACEGSVTVDLEKKTASSAEVKWDDVSFGYYLLTSGLGATITVNANTPDVTVIDKNQVPGTVTKTVNDDTIEIGETMNFTITYGATNYNGEKKIVEYTIVDTMATGMILTAAPVVKVGGKTLASSEYTFTGTVGEGGFTVVIPWVGSNNNSLYDNSVEITVTYSAKLTAAAQIDGNGVNNGVKVTPKDEDGNYPDGSEDNKKVYTFALAIKKVNEKGEPLADAEFTLKNGNNDIKFSVVSTSDDKNIYVVDPNGEVTKLVSPKNGLIIVKGVDSDEYTLTEVKAPKGYNLLTDSVSVNPVKTGGTNTKTYFDKDGNVLSTEESVFTSVTIDEIAAKSIMVLNKSGTELPSTGGVGTTIFYAVGGLMMAGAAILLITRKKMSNEE